MTEEIRAADLALSTCCEISGDQTIGEAMRALIDLQADERSPNVLAVVDAGGAFEGLLTARLLFKSLLGLWMPSKAVRGDEQLLEAELLEVVEDRKGWRLRDALVRGQTAANPDDRLLDLIDLACDGDLEFVPVVVEGRLQGVVPVTGIFHAAASLALTPEHEGIRFDQAD